MPKFTLNIKVKRFYFDRPRIKRGINQARKRVLSRQGSYVRGEARDLLRPGKKSSCPGKPPKVHPKGKTKKGKGFYPYKQIFFHYRRFYGSVIVGALGFGDKTPVPEIHEKGLTVTRIIKAKTRAKKKPIIRAFTARYPKRPTMQPALEKAKPKFPSMWEGSIR